MPATPFIVLPDGLTSVTQAVNVMLQAIGETPVANLNPPPNADAIIALGMLTQQDKALQSQGWSWNREYNLQLTLADDGTVPVPAQTLDISTAYSSPGQAINFVVRGGNLYDLDAHSPIFKVAPYADVILRMEWEDLPEAARQVITLRASREFLGGMEQGAIKAQVNAADLGRAITTLEQREDERNRFSEIKGNIDTRSRLYGVGLRRRNSW